MPQLTPPMPEQFHRFKRHYTRDEAQALLPQVRQWLQQLESVRRHWLKYDRRLAPLMEQGIDAGGELVNQWITGMAGLRGILNEFHRRDILLKDPGRGLVDFPAILGGKEVLLCWEKDETTIEFWHDLDAGYAGRERL